MDGGITLLFIHDMAGLPSERILMNQTVGHSDISHVHFALQGNI